MAVATRSGMKKVSRTRSFSALVLGAVALFAACSKKEEGHSSGDHSHAPVKSDAAKAAKPHGGHDPAYGGMVLMDAFDHHVELVLDTKSGKHRVYVSDGARAPLPASTFDEVTLAVAADKLAMTRAADDSHWEASGKPAPETGAEVSISYGKGGKQIAAFEKLAVEYVLTGKMPEGSKTPAGGEAAQAAPHGGLMQPFSGGHIELVADPSGAFKVWLLGPDLAPMPIDGASVKISVTAKGYADVVAEAKDDHFEGKGAKIGGHADAVITATVGGKTETARFKLHLESGGHGH